MKDCWIPYFYPRQLYIPITILVKGLQACLTSSYNPNKFIRTESLGTRMCRRLVHVCLPRNNNGPRGLLKCIWLAHACMKAHAIPIPCSATEPPGVCGTPKSKVVSHSLAHPARLSDYLIMSFLLSYHICPVCTHAPWNRKSYKTDGRWLWISKLLSSF